MVLVFDLDDTLYEEASYVMSGFKAVASFADHNWKIPAEDSFSLMKKIFTETGRGHIFDEMLKKYDKYSKANIAKCVSAYRSHEPEIHLFPDALRCLQRFSHLPLYIVTDGNKIVQNRKIKALGLQTKVKRAFITYRHGLKNSKPSPYCLLKISKLEKTEPGSILYVGDNPNKDFIGIKPLGFKTVRILRGEHKDVRLKLEHDAHEEILSLDEITPEMLKEMENNERN